MEAFFGRSPTARLPARAWSSLKVLLMGYAAGIVLATCSTGIAIASRFGTDFLETLTSMFNPLPAIALLPLALIWFGLGNGSLIFVLVHSVTWAIALNTHSGFLSVSRTLRMVGRNYGLSGPRLIGKILIPAAFPSILTGLKVGWAFAWRTLIAAELVFGVSSGAGGLGCSSSRTRTCSTSERVRRAAHRDPDRSRGGEPDLPDDRAADHPALGDAGLTEVRHGVG